MRKIGKQVSQSEPRIRRRVKTKRQAYADLRYLVSLETLAKKVKLPFIRRTAGNSIDEGTPEPPGTQTVLPERGVEPLLHNGSIGIPLEYPPNSRNVLVVIDQRLNMYYGSQYKMKSVVAAEAAALVAWHAFAQKDRVGAIAFDDRETAILAPYYSRVQIMLIFHDLLNQNHRLSSSADHKSNAGMLNRALYRTAAIAPGNFQIVLITDGSGQDQETGKLLQNISARNDLAVILVYDPRQIECSNVACFNSNKRAFMPPDSNQSSLFPDRTLIIPLSNQIDVTDQFRRGFRRLLQAIRKRSKRPAEVPQLDRQPSSQTGPASERIEAGNGPTVSRIPSPLATPESLCVRLNSR